MSDAREEAERLVAAILGGASVAAADLRGFATGSAECCVCPLCRAIAATRDPGPEFAERLASGAGEIAVGLASVLRAFAGAAGAARRAGAAATGTGGRAGHVGEKDPWRAATRHQPPTPRTPTADAAASDSAAEARDGATNGSSGPKPAATKPMAKKAVKPKRATGPVPPPAYPRPGTPGQTTAEGSVGT